MPIRDQRLRYCFSFCFHCLQSNLSNPSLSLLLCFLTCPYLDQVLILGSSAGHQKAASPERPEWGERHCRVYLLSQEAVLCSSFVNNKTCQRPWLLSLLTVLSRPVSAEFFKAGSYPVRETTV